MTPPAPPTVGIVYVESSAVLAWLLGEPTGEMVRGVLDEADRVVTSALTAVECARALQRARLTSRLTPINGHGANAGPRANASGPGTNARHTLHRDDAGVTRVGRTAHRIIA